MRPLCFALLTMMLGCGRDSRSIDTRGNNDLLLMATGAPETGASQNTKLPGHAALKVRNLPRGDLVVLTERLTPQWQVTRPERTLLFLDASLHPADSLEAPAGWFLIDFALHPSGAVSWLLASDQDNVRRYRLGRFSTEGATPRLVGELTPPLTSAAALPLASSLDTAKLVPLGEDIVLVARMPDESVWAQRFAGAQLSEPDAWAEPRWATLVEPPSEPIATGIQGGGFDNFGQGDHGLHIQATADDQDNIYIAVAPAASPVKGYGELLASHQACFNETFSTPADRVAALVTGLDAAGHRLFSLPIGSTILREEVHALRCRDGLLYAVGRTETSKVSADAWDGLLHTTVVPRGIDQANRLIHIDRGDAILDVQPLEGGEVLAVGTTRYSENPHGVSVSTERQALAVRLDRAGRVVARYALPQGPRGNEARSAWRLDPRRVVVVGMNNAPGTHSADLDADGFVTVVPF